jgi:hypothetical protein
MSRFRGMEHGASTRRPSCATTAGRPFPSRLSRAPRGAGDPGPPTEPGSAVRPRRHPVGNAGRGNRTVAGRRVRTAGSGS